MDLRGCLFLQSYGNKSPLAATPWRQMLHQQQQLIVSGRTTAYQVTSGKPGPRNSRIIMKKCGQFYVHEDFYWDYSDLHGTFMELY